MKDPDLDLSIPTLMKACKGNVKNLPSFMVHDDNVWPRYANVRTDNKGRIHMRRSTFLRVVAGKLPLREGIWHRIDVQEFYIDLKPHHLQGSGGLAEDAKRQVARVVSLVDDGGRSQGDEDYGDAPLRTFGTQDIERDRAEAKAVGASGIVGSSVLTSDRSE